MGHEEPGRRHEDFIRELIRSERYSDALKALQELERQRSLVPAELVVKGRLVQLAEEVYLPLSAAKQAFRSALELEPENVPAILELAWYLFSVEDMPHEAAPLFLQAIQLSQKQLTEAAQGRARCIAELESAENAASVLRDIEERPLLRESLTEEELEWLGRSADPIHRTKA